MVSRVGIPESRHRLQTSYHGLSSCLVQLRPWYEEHQISIPDSHILLYQASIVTSIVCCTVPQVRYPDGVAVARPIDVLNEVHATKAGNFACLLSIAVPLPQVPSTHRVLCYPRFMGALEESHLILDEAVSLSTVVC
jgi:hypothetical protein